jgi:aspartyl-tRNA(Asn)/glutamyl-tRNA(Gln) amidotransferase subunit B
MMATARWEVVIGLETHTQLSTAAKIFSGASTAYGAAPNSHAAAVDIALPGVLPVLNRGAVERAIRFGLAVGGSIAPMSVFARKNYFYPDLPKGYQISQYEIPVVTGGSVTVSVDGVEKVVRLTRAHLEEDAGKSLHENFSGMTGIDLNRAGTPLLEIVSEPDMRSAVEAVAYARTLHALVRWIGICDGNMQEGSFRCDANVSVRPMGSTTLGTRCEIKNLNSFRFMERAIQFEARRQIELIEDGGTVVQQTRLYDSDRDETRPMRSKEDAQDYRYFPDPDLPPLAIDAAWIARVQGEMPELPQAMVERFVREYGLSRHQASILVGDAATAAFYEAALAAARQHGSAGKGNDAELVANWVLGELSAQMHFADLAMDRCPILPATFGFLLSLVFSGFTSANGGKAVLLQLMAKPGQLDSDVKAIIERENLAQISDSGEIEALVAKVLAANAAIVAEFHAGKEKAFNALVGKVMAASKGKANPAQVNALLKKKLS